MDFEIFTPAKSLSTSEALERFLSCVNSDVVDQLVLGLESFQMTFAVTPVASVVALFRSSDVITSDVVDKRFHVFED